MKTNEEEDSRHIFRGELALVIAVMINSLAVILMLYSGSGISAISSVPYAFEKVFPVITLGTWTYIFQALLILSLMILRKKFVPAYLCSFLVGFAFSELLDVNEAWINILPKTIPLRVLYFVISYLLICIGIALSNRCGLPIIPTDLFPRELSEIIKVKYSKIKVSFDVICLMITACMTGLILGHINGLGIGTDLHYKTMAELNGSEKVKVLLAKALFGNPDILLLDEPTNHLDLDAIAWLEEFLINFENTVIVVSHDRYFLNKVCTQIADIDYAKIQLYAGNYDFWYESSQLIIKQMKEANKKKEEKIKELQDFIQRFSANASKSKQATSRKRALEKIELDEIKPSSRKYPYIDFRPAREIGNEVLTVEGISKTIDGVKVLDNVSFIVNHDDKIAFVGSNELATTTLFNIITGNMEPDEGSYKWGVTTSQAYFPKDSAAEFNREDTIVEWLTQYSPDPDPTYVRGFLGRMLFAGDDGVKKVKVLSGGEKVRCLISKMMICGANVLIFDDPTNHLDMESITALNNGLIKFPGVTLFTSHDHQFIQTTANRIMEIVPSGQLIDKITTYDEYLASDEMARKRQGFAEAASDDED